LLISGKFIKVPLTYQATSFSCGAAALQSVLYYYGLAVRERKMAERLHTNPEIGTEYKNIIKVARSFGFSAEVIFNTSLQRLEEIIDRQRPVIVLMQAWAAQPVSYQGHWGDEHYAVVIGYDRDNFYFMDPYTLGNYTYIPREQFLLRWHGREGGEFLKRLALVITREKGEEIYNPAQIFLLK